MTSVFMERLRSLAQAGLDHFERGGAIQAGAVLEENRGGAAHHQLLARRQHLLDGRLALGGGRRLAALHPVFPGLGGIVRTPDIDRKSVVSGKSVSVSVDLGGRGDIKK